jgi:hypothetical protein
MRHCAMARAPKEKDSGHGGFGLRGKIEALMATEEGPFSGPSIGHWRNDAHFPSIYWTFLWDGTIGTFSSYLS